MSANDNHPSQQNVSNVIFQRIASITAGNNLDYNLLYYGRHKLVSLSFLFTTNGTIADRHVNIICEKGGVNYYISCASTSQIASTSKRYYFGIHFPVNALTSPIAYIAPLPDAFLFFYADMLKTSIINLQVGDQLTEITMITEFQPTQRVF